MIERLDKRQVGAGPPWFAGEDERGEFDVWLEDGHVHIEVGDAYGPVIQMSPAAALVLASAILAKYGGL